MNILVTGAAGYIGSHAALRLLEQEHSVVAVDDLSRGHRTAIDILERFGTLHFHHGDLGDRGAMTALLRDHEIDAVMHFGAKAYVGESVEQPLVYYRTNTAAAIELLNAMADTGVRRIVFSSTCATYGEPAADQIPIPETCPQAPINPYGRSKLMVEHVLRDSGFRCAALRYFNVAGCDPAGRLGEDHDPETHLIPICLEAALGQRDFVTIFGTDYPTRDGTCVRDYVHVSDLVDAHVAALDALLQPDSASNSAPLICNVGLGRGYTVREVIDSVRRVTGVDFEVREGPRRPGDPPELYAEASRVGKTLRWKPRHQEIDDVVQTAWQWFRAHPNGYADADAGARTAPRG